MPYELRVALYTVAQVVSAVLSDMLQRTNCGSRQIRLGASAYELLSGGQVQSQNEYTSA